MKAKGGSKIEMNISKKRVEKSKERNVEYSAIGCKVTITFIIFGMCRKEGV
jgi:hypothetical protein